MFAFLLLLAQAAAPATALNCSASFVAADRTGIVSLWVSSDYRPQSMNLSLIDRDLYTRTQVSFDATDRAATPRPSSIFFLIRFTAKPTFPLTLKAYADGRLRWQKALTAPDWPASISSGSSKTGIADYVGRADDGLPVPAPREFMVVLTDAKRREVGRLRYPVLDDATQAAASTAIAAIETMYRERNCQLPPPLID